MSGTAPAGSVVVLEPLQPHEFPPATAPQTMDQAAMTFFPALLLARVGQRVEFRNSEDALHNVRVDERATGTPVFNVATPPYETYTHVFERPGYYDVSCDVHVAMRATILVTSTPYAALVGKDQTFTFPDVEPGSYTITMSGGGRELDQIVEVQPGGHRTVSSDTWRLR